MLNEHLISGTYPYTTFSAREGESFKRMINLHDFELVVYDK